MFQVCFRRFSIGRDSLEVKKIIKVKFLWITVATARRFYEWVSVFLEKRPRVIFELDCGPKVIPQWLCLYLSKRWQSVSWYNLHKELNGIKDFLVKKQFFLYWIRHRYQSKTCVEHIQQVIDKSLINPTNSSMNLYFLHVRVICFQYCKKRMRKSNQENFNFFGRIYGHVRFNDNGNRF